MKGLGYWAATYSSTCYRSTIGAVGLNFSVRNGKRWDPDAVTTAISPRRVSAAYGIDSAAKQEDRSLQGTGYATVSGIRGHSDTIAHEQVSGD